MHGVDDLKRALREHLRGREEVVAVYLFGSQLQGSMHGLSDVDVAVLVDPEKRALREVDAPLGYKAALMGELM